MESGIVGGAGALFILAVVVIEVVALRRLVGWAIAVGTRPDATSHHLPEVRDPALLEGLQGARNGTRYRWDPERGALLFLHARPRGFGERRGSPAGLVTFDPDGSARVRLKATPLTMLVALVGVGIPAGVFFGVTGTGPGWMALIAVLGFGPLIVLIATSTARHTVERHVLPDLAAVLREHLGA